MRAIYIARGSPLLPPAFPSIFDDLASSSLDIFFDPSHGLMKLPGLTVGIFLRTICLLSHASVRCLLCIYYSQLKSLLKKATRFLCMLSSRNFKLQCCFRYLLLEAIIDMLSFVERILQYMLVRYF